MPKTLDGIEIVRDTKLREYEEFRTQQIELAPILTPEWTDFFSQDGGVILLELNAGVADVISYYIDRCLNEAHFNTAQTKNSVYNHVKLTGYTPSTKSSATVTMQVTVSGAGTLTGINSISDKPVRVVSNAGPTRQRLSFELLEEFAAPSAGTYELIFIEGNTIKNELLGSSDGSLGQEFLLGQDNVTLNTDGSAALQIEVNELGVWSTWSMVSNFSESTSTSEHYVIEYTTRDIIKVIFGDGVNGKVPASGVDNIRATYRVGGGPEANFVTSGNINQVDYDPSGLITSVTNPDRPSGGSDEETLESIKANSAKYFSTQNRAVTYKDVEALAVTIPGVWKAKSGPVDDNPLHIGVWIAVEGSNPVPTGTWNPVTEVGTGMLGAVGTTLKSKKMASTLMFILPTTPVEIVAELDVYIKDDYYKSQIRQLVLEEVASYILDSNRGTEDSLITRSRLDKLVEDIQGVRYVDVTKFYRQAFIEEIKVGIADTLFSSVTIGDNVQDEIWEIFFEDATTFTVTGSATGLQRNVGTVNTEYTTDLGELSFQFNSNTIPNQFGDTYQIKTSKFVGNIDIRDKETPVLQSDSITINIIGGI